MVQEADLPRVAALQQKEWLDTLAQEGLAPVPANGAPLPSEAPNDEPPCPACGTRAPLVDGACSDCGLQLA